MKTLMLISVIMLVGCATAPTAESMAGTYELKKDGYTVRLIFRENGAFDAYKNGNKDEDEGKWKILNGEIHVKVEDGWVIIFRIIPDRGIAGIKEITPDGIQKDVPKEEQFTYKRTK